MRQAGFRAGFLLSARLKQNFAKIRWLPQKFAIHSDRGWRAWRATRAWPV